VLRRAGELDVNFIHTADAYGPKVSEELIAQTLRPYPDDLDVATKVDSYSRASGNHRPSPSGGQLESEGYRAIAGETLGYFHQRILRCTGR
jgi:aryl-alcohol dehydrogenase-like predicted oxidoreductase